MPIPNSILDDLAKAGANIVIDTVTSDATRVRHVVQFWDKGSGSVTIRNAGSIPIGDLVRIAQLLGPRVTLED
jgi:hypothetical protein